MKNRIIEAASLPRKLEKLYRENPKAFTTAFPEAFAVKNDSPVLETWNERLFFEEDKETTPASRWPARDIWLTLILSLIAGSLMKLPQFFSFCPSSEEIFYVRNTAGIAIGALIAFFLIRKRFRAKTAGVIITLLLGGIAYLNLIPEKPDSQTLILSYIHMQFFLWTLLGIAYCGGRWRDSNERMNYIRYNGELLIYSTIILIGGMVLTGLTIALFELINLDIEEWYLMNVVIYGSIASPIVATLLIDQIVGPRFRLAPLLAKVFTPLFLLTVIAYLAAMIVNRKSPFTDRDFLVAFNGLLLIVLGLCIFSISERGKMETTGIADHMNAGLVCITLAIDIVALAAILFRLSSYGFTPNRIAVLGANLLAFTHLAGILWHYIRFVRRTGQPDALKCWIVRYLPVYSIWSLIVAIGFPLLFRFK